MSHSQAGKSPSKAGVKSESLLLALVPGDMAASMSARLHGTALGR